MQVEDGIDERGTVYKEAIFKLVSNRGTDLSSETKSTPA